MHPIRRFPENKAGRDFVIGDPHGSYDSIAKAMKATGMDFKKDRLFCGGDLIDRGPDSDRCPQFAKFAPCVQGNHERDYCEAYEAGHETLDVLAQMNGGFGFNGMGWIAKASHEKRREIYECLKALPLVIEIETRRGLVGIVHADVPAGMHWEDFKKAIIAGDPKVIAVAVGGRDRVRGNHDGVPGIDRLYVGHNIQWGGMKRFGNVYAIDTGNVFGEIGHGRDGQGHLSFVNIIGKTEMLSAPRVVHGALNETDVRGANEMPHYPFSTLPQLALLRQAELDAEDAPGTRP